MAYPTTTTVAPARYRLADCTRCGGDLARDWDGSWRCLMCARTPEAAAQEARREG